MVAIGGGGGGGGGCGGELLGRLECKRGDMLFGFFRRQLFVSVAYFQCSPEEVVAQRVATGPLTSTVRRLHHHEDASVRQGRKLRERKALECCKVRNIAACETSVTATTSTSSSSSSFCSHRVASLFVSELVFV